MHLQLIMGKFIRERERETDRQTDRDRQRQTDRDRQRQTDRLCTK